MGGALLEDDCQGGTLYNIYLMYMANVLSLIVFPQRLFLSLRVAISELLCSSSRRLLSAAASFKTISCFTSFHSVVCGGFTANFRRLTYRVACKCRKKFQLVRIGRVYGHNDFSPPLPPFKNDTAIIHDADALFW